MDTVADKRCYEAPALTVIGTFEQVTQATGGFNHLDADFPAGTPPSDLTFS